MCKRGGFEQGGIESMTEYIHEKDGKLKRSKKRGKAKERQQESKTKRVKD